MVRRWIYPHATFWKSGHALPARLITAKAPPKAELNTHLRKELPGTARCMYKTRKTTYCTTWHVNARSYLTSCDRLPSESASLSIFAPSTNHDLRYGRHILAFSHGRANAWTRGFEAILSSRICVPGCCIFFSKVFNNVSLVAQSIFSIDRRKNRMGCLSIRVPFWLHT